jgi:glycosyltransferase involved in cell wall biosynthesis/ATP-dependent protease ClpP protease subunit
VPVYNMEKYIGQCLSAILSLPDSTMEVIVVDDGSTDGTTVVLDSFADARLKVLRKSHGGVSAARNAGFKHSRGEFVLPFDADDIPVVENWHSMLVTLAANPDAVLVYGARRVFEEEADNFWRSFPYPENDAVVPLIFKQNFMQNGSVVIRREAIEAAGLWNENLRVGEDWDIWCRLACLGHFIYCPVLVIGYRRHAQSAIGAAVSRHSQDPVLAAIETIYSHPSVRLKAGAHHHKWKQEALVWQTYHWGTRLIRSGAYWPGAKALVWAMSKDPLQFLYLCSFPYRRLRQLMDRRKPLSTERRRMLGYDSGRPLPARAMASKPFYVSFNSEVNQITGPALVAIVGQQVRMGFNELHLLLSTPGGHAAQGIAIYNMLRALPISVTTYNVGSVNSVGNVIFLAGSKRYASQASSFGFDVQSVRFEEKMLKERLPGTQSDQKLVSDIIARHTKISANEAEKLFLEAAFLGTTEAKSCDIIDDILDVQIPAGAPFLRLVFQRHSETCN